MQAGLINGIQQIQGQMYSLKYDTLPQLKAAASSMPTDTPQYAQLQGQIKQIETRGAARACSRRPTGCRSRSPPHRRSCRRRRSLRRRAASSAASSGSRQLVGLVVEARARRPRCRSAWCASATSRRSPTRRSTAASAAARTASPAALIDIVKTQDAQHRRGRPSKVTAEMDKLQAGFPGADQGRVRLRREQRASTPRSTACCARGFSARCSRSSSSCCSCATGARRSSRRSRSRCRSSSRWSSSSRPTSRSTS